MRNKGFGVDGAYNRTTLELKFGKVIDVVQDRGAYNRTTLELKYEGATVGFSKSISYNRTTLELKYVAKLYMLKNTHL